MDDGYIYLVRHGEAAASWGEDPDPPLSDQGRDEAIAASETLQQFSAGAPTNLISSPLLRAQQTAQPLSKALALPVSIDERFREIPSPVPLAERQQWLRAFMQQRWAEQGDDLLHWREAMFQGCAALPAGTAVFSHFLVINSLAGQLLEREETLIFWPANASITVMERRGGKLHLVGLGEEMPRARVN